MKIRKFCACGVKLERDVSDEETARKVVELFWTEHAGVLHGPVNQKGYAAIIRRIISRRSKANVVVASEIETLEKQQIDEALEWLEQQENEVMKTKHLAGDPRTKNAKET